MKQPCDSCGRPSENPTCERCLSEQNRIAGYPAWSEGAVRPERGHLHDKRVNETRQHLTELPDLYAQLWMFTKPGSAPKDPDQRSGKSNPARRSVVNLDVLDLTDERLKADAEDTRTDYTLDSRAGARRQGVVNTLAAWSRLVCSELADAGVDTDLAEEPTITSECGYLLTHLDWIAEQQWFDDELHPDVRQMRADVRRAIGDRDDVTSMPCLDCGWEMVGQGDYDAERKRFPWYKCSGCSKTAVTQAELDRIDEKARDTVTLSYAARMLKRPVSTLKEWVQQGWVRPEGSDTRGTVYSLTAFKEHSQTIKRGRKPRDSGQKSA